MSAAKQFATALAAALGKTVTFPAETEGGARPKYQIVGEADGKTGKVDGTDVAYGLARLIADPRVVKHIHPSKLIALVEAGRVDGMILTRAAAKELVVVPEKKTDAAARIFKEEQAKAQAEGDPSLRQRTMNRFIGELGMSDKGANTYFQNCKTGAVPAMAE